MYYYDFEGRRYYVGDKLVFLKAKFEYLKGLLEEEIVSRK